MFHISTNISTVKLYFLRIYFVVSTFRQIFLLLASYLLCYLVSLPHLSYILLNPRTVRQETTLLSEIVARFLSKIRDFLFPQELKFGQCATFNSRDF